MEAPLPNQERGRQPPHDNRGVPSSTTTTSSSRSNARGPRRMRDHDHDHGHEGSNQDDHLDHHYDSHPSKQHSHQPQQRQHPQQRHQQQSYSQLNGGRSTNGTSTSSRAVHSHSLPQGDVMEVPIAQLQGGAQAQMADAYPPEGEYPPAEDEYAGDSMESGERAPCPICQRMFAVERLRKHAKICEKSTKKLAKRKLPPPKAVLVEQAKEEIKGKLKGGGKAGKEIGGGSSLLAHDNVPIGGQNAGSKWRRDRDQLREAMQAARAYAKAKKEGGPLPPPTAPTIDPSLVPCPHCGRRFNENAAQRHIPICARKAQNVANQNRGRRR